MKITIGQTIRELRRRDGRTQEDLAGALGVTAQAVSRWESGGSYPDMEIVPSIANYFGVSIDVLFGYHGEREAKIDALLAAVDEKDALNLRDDCTYDECIAMLREGLAEFPGNERITHRLANLLNNAGWTRHTTYGSWRRYDDADGCIRYNFDPERRNPYWTESVKLYESLLRTAEDPAVVTDATCKLILTYRVFGEYEKGRTLALRLPSAEQCREVMLATAFDGAEQKTHLADALETLAVTFAEQFMYALINDRRNFTDGTCIAKVRGLIGMFDLLDGAGAREVAYLYLYLARLEWEFGSHDAAFAALDDALICAKRTGDLAPHLPEDFPMWTNPEYRPVKAEMMRDERWNAWAERCGGVE